MTIKTNFAFQLGREYKLSIAELMAVFPDGETVYFDHDILILNNITQENINTAIKKIGGTIKIIEIGNSDDIIGEKAKNYDGKFIYGINIFGKKNELKKKLSTTKKMLQVLEVSSRFVNKDFQNLSSAQIIREKLLKKGGDYNYIYTDKNIYFGKTIWVQDIDSYSKRDYEKTRDMQVGMLPPKLAQIMLNLSGGKKAYDPFVGLGSVLIEAKLMGFSEVFGSDISEKMVETAQKNLNIKEKNIFFQNAKYIHEVSLLRNEDSINIITEGYLGEIMTQKNISIERIAKQRKSLSNLYQGFFSGLSQINFGGNIVISFPFWEMKGKYIYFEEIYDIIHNYCEVLSFFDSEIDLAPSKSGSLLYKRKNQLVGREIFKLTIK